jgi:hypothetical protein
MVHGNAVHEPVITVEACSHDVRDFFTVFAVGLNAEPKRHSRSQ